VTEVCVVKVYHDYRQQPGPTATGDQSTPVENDPVVLPMMVAVFMFLPAGTWAWTKGWLFILVLLGTLTVVCLYVWRVNPEVLVARSRTHGGTKRWDKILLCFLFPTMWAVVVVAALDDGRFHWCPLPWWVCGVGYLMLLVGIGIGTWPKRRTGSLSRLSAFKPTEARSSSTAAPTPSSAIPVMQAQSWRR